MTLVTTYIGFRLTLETIIGLEIRNNNRPVLIDFLQIILSRQKSFYRLDILNNIVAFGFLILIIYRKNR